MLNELFVAGLGAVLLAYLVWGFRALPAERWQILATLPRGPAANGEWLGLNLTYYGLFSSLAQIVSVMTVFLLFGAVGITRTETVLLTIITLGVCIPGSKAVAAMVEGKSATFSVSGAAFIGILLAPWAILFSNATVGILLDHTIPVLPALAAIAIAYGFGEGLGRLACISFGCCYGKPLRESHPLIQTLFRRWHFVFRGETKKIAYAARLEGEKVVPIQAVTATLCTGAGLAGMLLFLHGAYASALLATLGITQLWRALSETLRADWRGAGRFSAYQWMSLASLPYTVAVVLLLPPQAPPTASLLLGLETLWHPGLVLFLFGLWITTFIYYGRSLVTGSRLSLYVCHDRI
jgi:prolipoprotein diacylglyceryltransferase